MSRIGASLAGRFLIDPQCFAFPGSFRIPEPSSSAFASRRPRPVSVLPLRSSRARLDRDRLSTITVDPVRSLARWSRSRTVFLFSPFGAESPLCVHSRLRAHDVDRARPPCGVRARSSFMPTSRRSRLLHDCPPCDGQHACIRARLAMFTCVRPARSPFGVRAFFTFVNNLDRSPPPAMFARLTALGHFRRQCSTAAAFTSLCTLDTLRCRRCPHS